jgi:hypothetical protein
MSNRTDSDAPDLEAVEAQIRSAIAEAASNVEASADEAPTNLTANADAAASAANVATVWTNVTVGMVAGLERLRLAHDQVKGAGQSTPPALGDEDRARKLVAQIKGEAENGASPTRIAQLIADSGVFVGA